MKKRMLVLLIVMGLAVGTASAQFGGVVYDPTNYANALKRYFQLQQQLIQLKNSYSQLVAQYNLAVQMAKNIQNMPARFGLTVNKKIRAGKLPPYPDTRKREELFVVVGEVHNKRKPGPSETPHWLTIPERGLFTGTAIEGAIGTGKTSCCMYPFAEQILAYRASDKEKRIGGLFLEVQGDFCHKVRDILKRHDRAEDYVEIGLGSEYRYNPLNNDLDAYALAYNIASLLNNLFGRGKEPFWQQAYTNLVKFIILLHKVA